MSELLPPRLKAEFLALSLALLPYDLSQDDAALNAAALRPTRPEPPRDLDLPLLPHKEYPTPPAPLVEAAQIALAAAPPPRPDFVGRGVELGRAVGSVMAGKPVILTGSSGTGKTLLLRHIAHDPRLRQQFRRVWWLGDVENAGILFGLALEAPNVLAARPEDQPAQARDFMLASRTLVLIDDAPPDRVEWLSRFTPHIVFATTDDPGLPDSTVIPLVGLPGETAANWLAERASLPEAAANVLAGLADGLPGTLRLLGGLLAEDEVPVDAIRALLTDTEPDQRHAALYMASFEALPEPYAALLSALAATPGRGARTDQVLARFDRPLTGQRALTFLERRGFLERYTVSNIGWVRATGYPPLREDAPGFEIAPSAAAQFLKGDRKTVDPRAAGAQAQYDQALTLIEECRDAEAEALLTDSLAARESAGLRHAAAESLVALARLAYLNGNDAIAIRQLEKAAEGLHYLRDEESLEVVRIALSRAYRRAGRADAALSVLGDDSPPEDLTAVYRQRGDWTNALAAYDRWLLVDPANEAARLGRAETLILANRYADALASVASDTTFVGGWIRATIAALQGQMTRALELYAELDVPPEYRAAAARAAARVAASLGEVGEATRLMGAEGIWYEAKLPRPIFARQRLSQAVYAHLCLMNGQPDEAAAAARLALELPGERPDVEAEATAWRVLGRIARANGDMDTARAAFEAELTARATLKDEHEIGLTLHNLAEIQAGQDESERAIANLRRALTHKDVGRDRRSVAQSRLALFGLLRELRRTPEALEVGQSTVDLLLARPEADLHLLGHTMIQLAQVQAEAGRHQRAAALLDDWIARLVNRQAEGIVHAHPGLQMLAIGLHLRTNPALTPDPVGAIDLAERALALAEAHAAQTVAEWAARRDLGQIYLRLERWPDAAEILEPLLAAMPEDASEPTEMAGSASAAEGVPSITGFIRLAAHLGMARVRLGSGETEAALMHFDAAMREEPDPHLRGLIAQEAAAACHAAGDDVRAVERYAQALELLRRERDMQVFTDTLVSLAYARLRLRRFGEAIDTFGEALQTVEKAAKRDPMLLAGVLHDMAAAHFTLGQYRSAATAYRASMQHQEAARSTERLKDTLIGLARSEAACANHQPAIAAYHDLLHRDDLAPDERRQFLTEQAAVFMQAGQAQPAIDSYQDALAIEGGSGAERAAIHRGLGVLYTGLKNHLRARDHFEAVLGIVQDERTGVTLQALGDSLRAQGQAKEAIDAYGRALDFIDRRTEPSARAGVERALGELYLERSQYANALAHLEQALEIERALPQQNGGAIVAILQHLARAHEQRGELDKATLRHHEALVYQDVRHAPEAYISTLQTLGRLYTELKRYGEAAKAYDEALRAEGKTGTPNQARVVALTFALAGVRQAQGSLEAAAEGYRRVVEMQGGSAAVREEARKALRAVEAEITRHVNTLQAAEQSWLLLSRTAKPDLRALLFIRALQAQTAAALGRREEADQRVTEMLELLSLRRHVLLDGNDPTLADLLSGWEHETAGDLDAARTAYGTALETASAEPHPNQAFLWAIRRKIERR